MKRKWFQITAGMLLAAALLAYPLYAAKFDLSEMQALGLFVGFGTYCYWYFDARMDNVLAAVDESLRGHIAEGSLADAFSHARKQKQRWRKIRILATSTGQIQPLFHSTGLEADEVEVVVRSIGRDEAERNPKLNEFQSGTELILREWGELKRIGRIAAFKAHTINFFPLDYVVIFDDQILVCGLLMPEAGRYSEVEVATPTVTTARTIAATREIKKHTQRFDKLVAFSLEP